MKPKNDDSFLMPALFIERGKDVIVQEDRKPVLYDHKERPLTREVGFRK